MPRFVWLTAVAVEAETLQEAAEILARAYEYEDWNDTGIDRITMWSPGGDPHETLEDDERVGDCTCPPGLVERGGFRSDCPEHGIGIGERA